MAYTSDSFLLAKMDCHTMAICKEDTRDWQSCKYRVWCTCPVELDVARMYRLSPTELKRALEKLPEEEL